jgi:type IV pilus assembly protein PilO
MGALDEFAKISVPRKVAGVVVLFALLGTGYYFARYQSLASEHTQLVRRHSALEREERENLAKRDSYEADVRRLAQMRESFATQSRILPRETEMSSFLESLNNHAELAGLEIALVQPLDEEGAGFYAKIPVELHLKGRYHELAKFFYNIGRLERVINVEDISFASSSKRGEPAEGEDEVRVNAQVLATTFRALEGSDSEAPAKRR